MRILFAGSPMIAVPCLRALSELEAEGKGISLAGILTNPDSKKGRYSQMEATDVSMAASELDAERKKMGLKPIVQVKPEKLNAEARREIAGLKADLLVSFACGHFFGPACLSLFPLGGINIHPSLLPKYRGASPIPAVILAREKETGICIQKLAAEIDTGDILALDRFDLGGRETTSSLSEIVSLRAGRLLSDFLLCFGAGAAAGTPQEGTPSYCTVIKKEDGFINWSKSAVEIDAAIRAYTPWPLSFTCRGKDRLFILEAEPFSAAQPGGAAAPRVPPPSGETPDAAQVAAVPGGIMVSRAPPPLGETPDAAPGTVLGTDRNKGILIQTGNGILAVTKLQWQAKKALDWKSFCNGTRDFAGSCLG